MVPEFPDLRPLSLDDHAMLVERLGRVAPAICDLTPANLFIWRGCERSSLTRIGDSLCILVEPHAEPAYFLEPVGGNGRVDAVQTCLTRVDQFPGPAGRWSSASPRSSTCARCAITSTTSTRRMCWPN